MNATGPTSIKCDSDDAPPSNARALVRPIVLLTIAIEVVTVVLRFGFALDSTRDTASTIGVLTLGLRVHHGYCGIVIVLVAWGLSQHFPRCSRLLYIVGWSLFLSDVIHHFAVLWPITGTPQFDLFYPM